MTNIIKIMEKSVKHWYLRYLLVTELYMVEPWEKAVIQIVFAILFLLCWYFNYSIVMSGISHLRGMVVTAD
ncbi:serine palmitoyltransferase small subunit A [Amyelois transitella]|uniref:serine palmitoyltransferase small subunit A n=1 Tax=Amyelois transitella TaxID=680683 RepID=UPI00067D1F73|nr:serine palmitoyltransferase small subunit A [Amyelois transitella]